jgi:hypothetical protein
MRKRGDAHGTPAQHSKPSRACLGGTIHGNQYSIHYTITISRP